MHRIKPKMRAAGRRCLRGGLQLWAALMLLAPTLAAQAPGPEPLTTQQLQTILAQHAFVGGGFNQIQQIEGVAGELRAQGDFFFVKEVALLWYPHTPPGERLIFSRKNSNLSASQRLMSRVLMDVFSAKVLNDRKFVRELTGNKDDWHLTLTPRRRSLARHIQKIELRGAEFVRAAVLQLGRGRTTRMTFDATAHTALPAHLCAELGSLYKVMQAQEAPCEQTP